MDNEKRGVMRVTSWQPVFLPSRWSGPAGSLGRTQAFKGVDACGLLIIESFHRRSCVMHEVEIGLNYLQTEACLPSSYQMSINRQYIQKDKVMG